MEKQSSAIKNYSNIVFVHFFNKETMCYDRGHCHFLIYVFAGVLIIKEPGNEDVVISAGQCVFVPRNHKLTFIKRPSKGVSYKGITMAFERNFLRLYYQSFNHNPIPANETGTKDSVIKLPSIPDINSLFLSLLPYFDSDIKPNEEIMKLKREEGILALLDIDSDFSTILFDFIEPWKIDIIDFLNENYMYEFTLEEIATYTGRSLATFKRDFKKISTLTPQRWIMQKRLEVAKEKLRAEGKKVADVYMEVGFKNRSHFTTAYRKHYGYPPTSII